MVGSEVRHASLLAVMLCTLVARMGSSLFALSAISMSLHECACQKAQNPQAYECFTWVLHRSGSIAGHFRWCMHFQRQALRSRQNFMVDHVFLFLAKCVALLRATVDSCCSPATQAVHPSTCGTQPGGSGCLASNWHKVVVLLVIWPLQLETQVAETMTIFLRPRIRVGSCASVLAGCPRFLFLKAVVVEQWRPRHCAPTLLSSWNSNQVA
mmetsp:Transcript_35903/g.71130  ORF Transcript_35903/g.71130 Transcript_35903/m.71130 type:complete len:211 (+) Transcript_35903:286-918(+)